MNVVNTNGTPAAGKELAGMSLLALGVVYGDIGTSPLYAMRECFHGPHAVATSVENVYGVLSLIFWSLVVVVSVKYLLIVLRADDGGEGGILALMALLSPRRVKLGARHQWVIVLLGLFGAALLYGDGMITPAISVLGAMEGLELATPALHPFIVPISIGILIGLFMLQKHGTAKVGAMFGPVMIVWFTTLALMGLMAIIHEPHVLAAVNPWYAIRFFLDNGVSGYLILGAVFLVVTGGEALYADLGHFGARPIRLSWFTIVLPALLLNYFGQGALLLHHPDIANPFYQLAPSWALYPLIVLATIATVIASQAVISGVFSLTMQAVAMGYLPRVQISHTSEQQVGQIYIAAMNWILLAATIALVIGFGSSSALAAAYGVAVTVTMLITTVLLYLAARHLWKWNMWAVAAMCAGFFVVDLAFFGANIIKVEQGGWFPLVIAGIVFTLMTTWRRGRQILGRIVRENIVPLDKFRRDIQQTQPHRVEGTAIYMTSNPDGTPMAMIQNLEHYKVLHERVILLHLSNESVSYVKSSDRLEIEELDDGFWRVTAHYGYMEEPHIPFLLKLCEARDLLFDMEKTTFFLGRENVIATRKPGMAIWRERLFAAMQRNALSATRFFHIPPHRVIEVGTQVEI